MIVTNSILKVYFKKILNLHDYSLLLLKPIIYLVLNYVYKRTGQLSSYVLS